MRLAAFSLQNYRSIQGLHRLEFGDCITTLIGPNNEGKSNILRALVTAFRTLSRLATGGAGRTHGELRRLHGSSDAQGSYAWERDYPVLLRATQPDGATRLMLEFKLTKAEQKLFAAQTGTAISDTVVADFRLEPTYAFVAIRDKDIQLSLKLDKLRTACRFLNRGITAQYIPSVRTAEAAQETLEAIVQRNLTALESKREYRTALRAIKAIQKPVLNALSKTVTSSLKEFLPNVRTVKLIVSDEDRDKALTRACTILVDDGTETELSHKGDGVQSLAAMSLMRQSIRARAGRRRILLAVEEPETHLHSRAIHQLRIVLNEIATKHQVIISTHHATFVNRERISTNVLVSANAAVPARSTEQIRDTLGVRPAENLRHADLVLVVEGDDDRIALTALLRTYSSHLRAALANGVLALDSIGGSSNLTYKLSLLRNSLCSAFVFVDNDKAGKDAVQRAITDKVLTNAQVKFPVCRGKKESELEDLYDVKFFGPVVLQTLGVDVTPLRRLLSGDAKWSDRLRVCVETSGQQWNDQIKAQLKSALATAVAAAPREVLRKATRAPLDALVRALEQKLADLRAGAM